MEAMRRLLFVLPVAAVFVVVGVGLFSARPAQLGQPAPDVAQPSLADPDEEIRLADLRGRPVVLNFWASWCEPCKQEAPDFARVARAYSDQVAFLGVDILDGREEALEFVETYDIPYPSVRDASGTVAEDFEVNGVPETIFIDAEGRIVGKHIGQISGEDLERLVSALAELPPGEVLEITGRGESRPVP